MCIAGNKRSRGWIKYTFMEEGYNPYREELARELRAEADRSKRRDLLREKKLDRMYLYERAQHSIDNFFARESRKLEDMLTKTETLEAVQDSLHEESFFIHGRGNRAIAHSEHLIKQIEMASRLGCRTLLPEAGGMREKVGALLEADGTRLSETADPEVYASFLQERFAAYAFSPSEIEQIAQKMPPDVFASVDGDLEDAVVLLNALPNTETKFSCAGHTDFSEADISHTSTYSGYVFLSTEDDGLIEALNTLQTETDGFRCALENDDGHTVRFYKEVPDSWIALNVKQTPRELFEKARDHLADLLESDDLLTYAYKDYEQNTDAFYNLVSTCQQSYIATHPETATIPFSYNSRYLRNIQDFLPHVLFEREYREYFVSDGAEKNRRDFLADLTDTVNRYRLSQKGSEHLVGS